MEKLAASGAAAEEVRAALSDFSRALSDDKVRGRGTTYMACQVDSEHSLPKMSARAAASSAVHKHI